MVIREKIEFESGFTLMEVMVVVAIIGILSAISIPMLRNPEHRVKKVARELMGDIQRTRMSAIRSNSSWRIVYTAGGYTVIDAGNNVLKTIAFSNYAAGIQYGGRPATGALLPDVTLPGDGISYALNTLTFTPRGTCPSGCVYINYKNVAYAVGTLSTGLVRIRRWTGGNWQ